MCRSGTTASRARPSDRAASAARGALRRAAVRRRLFLVLLWIRSLPVRLRWVELRWSMRPAFLLDPPHRFLLRDHHPLTARTVDGRVPLRPRQEPDDGQDEQADEPGEEGRKADDEEVSVVAQTGHALSAPSSSTLPMRTRRRAPAVHGCREQLGVQSTPCVRTCWASSSRSLSSSQPRSDDSCCARPRACSASEPDRGSRSTLKGLMCPARRLPARHGRPVWRHVLAAGWCLQPARRTAVVAATRSPSRVRRREPS